MQRSFRSRFGSLAIVFWFTWSLGVLFLGPAAVSVHADDTDDVLKELQEAAPEEETPRRGDDLDDPVPSEPLSESESTESEKSPPAEPEITPTPEATPQPEEEPIPEKKPAKGKGSQSLPPFEDVQKIVSEQLSTMHDYESGDLLTASNVAPIFKKLEAAGWKVTDQKAIEKQFLSDNDWLVRQFRTKNGRKFMREIGRNPGGFDRVDRLRRMPYGERQLADLIQKPGGHTMIDYMVTTPGGKNLGRSLSRTRSGGNFNASTGRLYDEKQLLDRLKQSYESALRRSGPAS